MRILVLVNDSLSPPGLIWDRFKQVGVQIVAKMPYQKIGLSKNADHHVPDHTAGYDGLLVLGGAMCADQDLDGPDAAQDFCFLPQQADLIRKFGEDDKPVLGICLGAQLVARAYDGALIRKGAPEFGFVPINYEAAANSDPLLGELAKDQSIEHIMQWHDDTFHLPEAAELLMTNEACRHQAFRIRNSKTWAFQFHPEVTAETVRNWAEVRARLNGLDQENFVRAAMLEAENRIPRVRTFIFEVVDRWLALMKQ